MSDSDLHTHQFNLSSSGVYTIGRSVTSDITLRNVTVSRKHAALVFNRFGDCFLIDFDSAQGSFINGVRALPQILTRVRRGVMLRFGGCEGTSFLYKHSSDGEETTRQHVIHDEQNQGDPLLCVCRDGAVAFRVGSHNEEDNVLCSTTLANTVLNATATTPTQSSSSSLKRKNSDGGDGGDGASLKKRKNITRSVSFSIDVPSVAFAEAVTPDEAPSSANSDGDEDTPPCSPKSPTTTIQQ